jgi:hypothetical protein
VLTAIGSIVMADAVSTTVGAVTVLADAYLSAAPYHLREALRAGQLAHREIGICRKAWMTTGMMSNMPR